MTFIRSFTSTFLQTVVLGLLTIGTLTLTPAHDAMLKVIPESVSSRAVHHVPAPVVPVVQTGTVGNFNPHATLDTSQVERG